MAHEADVFGRPAALTAVQTLLRQDYALSLSCREKHAVESRLAGRVDQEMLALEVALHDQPRLRQLAKQHLIATLCVLARHHVPSTAAASVEEKSAGEAATEACVVAAEPEASVRRVLSPLDQICNLIDSRLECVKIPDVCGIVCQCRHLDSRVSTYVEQLLDEWVFL